MAFQPDKTWASMSNAEVEKESKLTAKEGRAVAALFRAVRALPLGLTVDVDQDGMIVRKQVTYGYYHNVGQLKRKTLRDGRRPKRELVSCGAY